MDFQLKNYELYGFICRILLCVVKAPESNKNGKVVFTDDGFISLTDIYERVSSFYPKESLPSKDSLKDVLNKLVFIYSKKTLQDGEVLYRFVWNNPI